MKVFNILKVGLLGGISTVCASQSIASVVQIDLTGTITNTYISNVVDGNSTQEGASLWSISGGLPIGSALNFSARYSTNTPSSWHQTDGVNTMDQYSGMGLSVSAPAFQAHSPNNGVSVVNGLYVGWDQFSLGFRTPDNTGIKISFQNEIYYLVAASIMIRDESGTAFSDSTLPTDQSKLDAFWLNNSQPSPYGNHLANFDLQFVKDPLANSVANNTWPNGQALYVVGYFDGAKLTHVPEPTGLFLVLIGMIGLVTRRALKK